MRTLLIGSLVLFFASLGLAQDATCKKGEYETSVTIGAGNTFKYKTSAKGKYGDNVDCTVHYVLDDSCDEMTFSCKKINIKNKKDCSNGDTLVLSSETDEKVVCGKKKKFVFKSSSDLVVHFTSDSKKRAAGAKGCKVTCSRAATSSPSTPAPTTGAPTTTTTTTGAPTTTAAFSPSSSSCFDPLETVLLCSRGELSGRMESALLECDQYSITTTIVGGRSAGQGDCSTVQEAQENFNLNMQYAVCLYSSLGWNNNTSQYLQDVSSLRGKSGLEEELGLCLERTELALRESYGGCEYSEEEWTRLNPVITFSAYFQCATQLYSQECEEALSLNFDNWLHQYNTQTCNANTGEVCFDSNYGITKTCCEPNYCISVTNRTSTCQDPSMFTTAAAESCNANTGEVCFDSQYGISKTCCHPNYCISVTNRTSTCQDPSMFTTTTTTAESCNANNGEVCFDSEYGISKNCCEPNYCISVTNRTSTCQTIGK